MITLHEDDGVYPSGFSFLADCEFLVCNSAIVDDRGEGRRRFRLGKNRSSERLKISKYKVSKFQSFNLKQSKNLKYDLENSNGPILLLYLQRLKQYWIFVKILRVHHREVGFCYN